MRIGLISDTHGELDNRFIKHLKKCDEIWHAGDIGDLSVIEKLQNFASVVAVFGNIDNHIIRSEIPEYQLFERLGQKILMTHIGGYPGRYEKRAYDIIRDVNPQVFISGHSHILKIMFDKKHNLLHLNQGAAGNQGFHNVKTMINFEINTKIENLEVIEINRG